MYKATTMHAHRYKNINYGIIDKHGQTLIKLMPLSVHSFDMYTIHLYTVCTNILYIRGV